MSAARKYPPELRDRAIRLVTATHPVRRRTCPIDRGVDCVSVRPTSPTSAGVPSNHTVPKAAFHGWLDAVSSGLEYIRPQDASLKQITKILDTDVVSSATTKLFADLIEDRFAENH